MEPVQYKSMSSLKKNEQGMVSILVTMIMILVITLIVLGFAQVTRRNQREALDNQLSTQAYYAAESGVNAAVNYLSTHPTYGMSTIGNCTQFINTLGGGTVNVLDQDTGTKYTCLMVNPTPSSLNVAPLTQGTSAVLHLANSDGAAFTSLKFQWSQQATPDYPGGCTSADNGTLPALSAWACPYGILRLDLVNTSGSNASNDVLDGNQQVVSFYMIPTYNNGAGVANTPVTNPLETQPVDPSSAPGPTCTANAATNNCPVQVVRTICTAGGSCSLQLNLNGTGGSIDYYARLSMMYQDSSNVIITGTDSGHPSNFVGGQVMVDSTGESQDELRRIQVRVPIVAPQSTLPVYSLQTTASICKKLSDMGAGSTAASQCP
jgi:Tfp pilus assembly protein PilX